MKKVFDNIDKDNAIQWYLYDKKEHVSLSDFWGGINKKQQPKDYTPGSNQLKELDLTLKYLYPLLRDGKLKVRINNYKKEYGNKEDYKDGFIYSFYQGREYKKEEAKKAIKYIRNKWLSIKNKRERESFESYGVEFTLPENKWRE